MHIDCSVFIIFLVNIDIIYTIKSSVGNISISIDIISLGLRLPGNMGLDFGFYTNFFYLSYNTNILSILEGQF